MNNLFVLLNEFCVDGHRQRPKVISGCLIDKKQESGISTKEVCRELGISEATFYKWKARYGGMEVSDVKKLKDMEAELSQYKKIVAELTFENRAMKGLIEKKF